MIRACSILTGSMIGLAAMVTPANTTSDRQMRDLASRVEKLERATNEANRKLETLTKTVSDLNNTIGSGRQSDRSARDLARRNEMIDRRMTDIEKSLEQLNRFMVDMQKQAGPTGEMISTHLKRHDAQIKKIAEWLDQYHTRKDTGYYHRNAVERSR